MPTARQAKMWEEVLPGTFDRLMSEVEREEQHRRDQDIRAHQRQTSEIRLRYLGNGCGILTVIIFALLVKHFVDKGAPTQGAWIMGTAAVSIVGVFITGRIVKARGRRTAPSSAQTEAAVTTG